MSEVVIVGMGFGGIAAAHTLGNKEGVHVTVIDRRNYHLFQPLLYQVATAGLDQDSIIYPIRAVVRRWRNVDFVYGNVTALDLEGQVVHTDDGEHRVEHRYDYLILAGGSETNFYGMEAVEGAAFRLKSLQDSVLLRNHILSMFEEARHITDEQERAELLTFVVVGAGATGVELCGALSELIQHSLCIDFADECEEARIVMVEAMDSVLPMMPASLQRYTKQRLERLGVEVLLNRTVTTADEHSVTFKDGSSIRTRTLVWSAGVKAVSLAGMLPTARGGAGRVRVRPDLSIPEKDNVFVIGDMTYLEDASGECLPMVAPVAKQEGEYVGRLIVQRERGGAGAPARPFRYTDRGFMAIIGRFAAVANPYGINMKGFFAWLAWLGLHLLFLVGFRNRLIAMLNWVYAYIFRDPKVRVITSEGPDVGRE